MNAQEFSERLWEFAARVGKMIDALPESRLGRHVAGQLVRSGTASAPNYDEGCSAESPRDFVHKISVATKEMRESFGWLRYIVRSGLLPEPRVQDLIDEADQLLRMLVASQKTAQRGTIPQSKINNPQSPVLNQFLGLDHLAIAVPSTEEALTLWRDTFGFEVLYSEDVNDATVRLTHLDLGNCHLQLVEPIVPDHPLHEWLAANGPGLHHFCLKVDNIDDAKDGAPVSTAPAAHQGTRGKRALFLDKAATQNVLVEYTGE